MVKFTIFTPTYNRENSLARCYSSILSQDVDSIEWLIVDDGSNDGTRNLVLQFIDESKLNIRYIYQENAGKQAAWNMGVINAYGKYFIGLDSDDALEENILKETEYYLDKIENNNSVIGMRCRAKRVPDTIIKKKSFSENDNDIKSWFEEFASGIFEERIDIFKTKIIKEYLYPVEPGVKFIPEIWFYCTISKKYNFFYYDKIISMYYDSSTSNRLSKSSIKKHAKGHLISRQAMLRNIPVKYFIKNPLGFLKTMIRYIQCIYYTKCC